MASVATLARDADDIVSEALNGGADVHAYADLLRSYISAPHGGRDALFIAVAYRLTCWNAEDVLTQSSEIPSQKAPPVAAGHQELLRLVRDGLDLLARQLPKSGS